MVGESVGGYGSTNSDLDLRNELGYRGTDVAGVSLAEISVHYKLGYHGTFIRQAFFGDEHKHGEWQRRPIKAPA